jgi:hypothetical protein
MRHVHPLGGMLEPAARPRSGGKARLDIGALQRLGCGLEALLSILARFNQPVEHGHCFIVLHQVKASLVSPVIKASTEPVRVRPSYREMRNVRRW